MVKKVKQFLRVLTIFSVQKTTSGQVQELLKRNRLFFALEPLQLLSHEGTLSGEPEAAEGAAEFCRVDSSNSFWVQDIEGSLNLLHFAASQCRAGVIFGCKRAFCNYFGYVFPFSLCGLWHENNLIFPTTSRFARPTRKRKL